MFDDLVLGVDPGTASVGLALVGRSGGSTSVLWWNTLRTPSQGAIAERLLAIHRSVGESLDLRRPATVAVERLLWGRNTQSAMDVARASGAVMIAAAERSVPCVEYAPLEVKMAVTGSGNAPKDAVRRALRAFLGVEGVPDEPDAADAVAVGVCHLQQKRMRRLVSDGAR